MFWKKTKPQSSPHTERDARLDRVGKVLVRAAAMPASELEKSVDKPFLYQRLRANIAAQQQQQSSSWYPIVLTAPRAIPIFLIIAALFLGLGWYRFQPANQPSGLVMVEPGMAAVASSCSLSNSEDCLVTNDEMLVTIFPNE